MWKSRCFLLLCLLALASAQRSKKGGSKSSPWKTLDGSAPLVIARGGFSGILPDSSSAAYQLAAAVSLPNTVSWCDVQLTKDAAGICFPVLTLENSSSISDVYPNKDSTYVVNGESVKGWFSVDYTLDELFNVTLVRGILSRPERFDGLYNILILEGLLQLNPPPPPGLWLNVQHDKFFTQQKLSMRSYILSAFKKAIVDYVSSPEVNFLKSIVSRKPSKTKLIFRFLGQDKVDPSINQTYGSLLSNLTFIKTFASGILVPKDYILPVDGSNYLQSPTSVVLDAHREGLEVYASGFANDFAFPYDFSYDPVAEYLSYIDNGNFSVDGVVSDFPITPSAAIDCFSNMVGNVSVPGKPLVISYQGSSGDYPGCTNLAYQKAILDGTEVLDCPVQMTRDGIPICLGSVNLMDNTNVARSSFNISSIPELGLKDGVPTFSLTLTQIQSLKPSIYNPYLTDYNLLRNPKNKEAGKLVTLSEFLDLANNASSVSSVLISIEDAAYLAEKQGLGVIDVVLDTLRNAALKNQKVMIQSTNSSVLKEFKKEGKYELVYKVDEDIRDADKATIADIATFANSVVVTKTSVFPPNSAYYLTGMTDIVQKLQKSKLQVFVELFRNEFVSQAWDFFSDATVEINTYWQGAGIDGIVTEFPLTAARYKKNRFLKLGNNMPNYMIPVLPGSLLGLVNPVYLPPAEAPLPVLEESDVAEPPLPPVANIVPTNGNNGSIAQPPTKPPSGQPREAACIFLSCVAVIFATLSLL